MTWVKVCGVSSVDDALLAADAGADFIGLVFAESSRRVSKHAAVDIAAALRSGEIVAETLQSRLNDADMARWFQNGIAVLEAMLARKRPLTVGVFVNSSIEHVNETAETCGLDLVQLSGDEPWHDCACIRRPVLKAVHIREDDSAGAVLARIEGGGAIACLLHPRVEGAYGGTGRQLDWRTAAVVAQRLPVFLSGGLTPDNVAHAVRLVRPWGVDVSSGVEKAGERDASMVRGFVTAAKGAL